MKIGILTFPGSTSYGASLQMFALYTSLKKMGFDVEVINYMNDFMKHRRHVKKTRTNLHELINNIRLLPKVLEFRRFEKNIVKYPSKQIGSTDEITHVAGRYDFVICGSDQVWNPLVTGRDYNYFLNFITDSSKKVAYAPSFGLTKLPEDVVEKTRDALSSFKKISVREQSGKEILKSLLGRECPIVCDPTFLLSKEEWKRLESPIQVPDKYVFYFMLNNDPIAREFAEEYSEKYNMPIICVIGTVNKNKYTKRDYRYIDPSKWLYAIDHATCVITDSFHGTAFSIIFDKESYISLASSTNSRICNLLSTFNLQQRALNSSSLDTVNNQVDSDFMDKTRNQLRSEGLSFLQNSLQ